ncbi:hypothetical protein QR680_009493 [Steinernema hermaphroditum]|uniref:Calcineurin-like phosphoesterase domain-containing protein n=1 Tax=Steinernema hermaphroditum TaxID=289476 RepID=A0AA39IMW8_9BILA|nr:hypothetical protein QR680_009493 [Steinernema hermaphroditum]
MARLLKRRLARLLFFVAAVFVFNEFLVYFLVVFFSCGWPPLSESATHAFVVADTHLLGLRKGHWFDKLRREWQMHRSFQSAVSILQPDAVFFLGDIFDEGQWSTPQEFKRYSQRFESLFSVADSTKRFVLAGNHDIGFHYAISPQRVAWFSREFNRTRFVDHVELNGNHFVLLNSMSMERDGCRLCAEAEYELRELSKAFECSERGSSSCENSIGAPYSRPILMQHFPLYRESDIECADDLDLAPEKLRKEPFREKWECLSKESTSDLIRLLKPRAAFGGHTHFGCQKWWSGLSSFWEYSVSSFSWRNTPLPALLLLSITPESVEVSKCLLPNENTVIAIYCLSAVFGIFMFLFQRALRRCLRRLCSVFKLVA